MSASPYTSMTGISSFFTSDAQSKSWRMSAPIASSSFGNSCGLGAIAAYEVYIGVSFIASAIFPLTAACCGSISAKKPFCAYGADTTTSRRTSSGCWKASCSAAPPPNE